MVLQTRSMAASRPLAVARDATRVEADPKALFQGYAGLEIARTLEDLCQRAFHFELEHLGRLLEMGLIEAGRMVRRAEATKGQLSVVPKDKASAGARDFKAENRRMAAAEIADAVVPLRAKAQEFDLKFLNYLLEMAYMEAFEQSQHEAE